MKPKYRLKGWVVACIYVISIGAIVSSMVLLGKTLKGSFYTEDNLSYVYHGIFEDPVLVVKYKDDKIIKPFNSEDVNVLKKYYDKDAESNVQEESLLFYQNTYMPNTGILYSNKESFDVVSVLDGTVESVVADEIMGNIVTVKHSNNLTTVYQCLNEVHVMTGDLIKQGDVIGTSGINKLESSSENMLLFEVIKGGEYINPDTFYNMKIEELS